MNFELLTLPKRTWLAEYHRGLYRDLESLLDAESAQWLASVVSAFADAVR